MKLRILKFLIALIVCKHASAQLERLPRIGAQTYDSTAVRDFGAILITTKSFDLISGLNRSCDTFAESMQIINPANPWPPVWFAIAPSPSSYYQNAKMLGNGDIVFYEYLPVNDPEKGVMKDKYGGRYVLLRNFSRVDSIISRTETFDPHDFSLEKNNDRLLYVFIDTPLDVSSITRHPEDTAKMSEVGIIEIWDSTGKKIFTWNPLSELSMKERPPEYRQMTGLGFAANEFDLNHPNSVSWAVDGNLLYSFRNMGVGKISRTTGKIMWRLGGVNAEIPLSDSDRYFGQHDFSQIRSGPYKGKYSLYSNGDKDHPARFCIYDVNEKQKSAKLVHQEFVDGSNYSEAAGNYTWVNDKQILCYGVMHGWASESPPRMSFARIEDSQNKVLAIYLCPTRTFIYRSQPLAQVTNWRNYLPPRPVIIADGDVLRVKAARNGKITWYEITTNGFLNLGEGPSIQPTTTGVFVAVEKLDFGYSVSKQIIYNK